MGGTYIMETRKFVVAFNQLSDEFLDRMKQTFPDEPKIACYHTKLQTLTKMNYQKPIIMFMEKVQPFGRQILLRDDNFFLQKKFLNAAESFSGEMGLRDRWEGIPQTTKDSIWEYMKNLYIIGMTTLDQGDELQKILQEVKNLSINTEKCL